LIRGDNMLEVRPVKKEELGELLELYFHLHGEAAPEIDGRIRDIWNSILSNPNYHIIVGRAGDKLVSTCILVVVPNLTHGQRPYAWIENVVTHPDHRGKGYATAVLDYAKQFAQDENCYKIMLMSGTKDNNVYRFYEGAGYNSRDKKAFIQWL